MAALACLSWLPFLRVSKAMSITPAGLASDSVVLFVTTKVGSHRELRRPLYGWGRSWVRFLRAYAQASCNLKVRCWLGEGLRQWRRPSRASSATPHTRVTDGTAYGGEAPPPPSTAPPTSPALFGGGGGAGLLRPWSTLWGTLPLQWLGHWSYRGLLASKLVVMLLADLWGDAMYAESRDSPLGESQDSPLNATHMLFHYRIF